MKIKETGSEVVFLANDANLTLIDKIQFTNLLKYLTCPQTNKKRYHPPSLSLSLSPLYCRTMCNPQNAVTI